MTAPRSSDASLAVSGTLRKPSATIHIAQPLTSLQRKLFNALCYHAQRQGGLADRELSIRVTDLLDLLQENSKRRDNIDEALDVLGTTKIRWNFLSVDATGDWEACTFLSNWGRKRGRFVYRINPKIVEQINNPVLYAKIHLLVHASVRRASSLALYEVIVENLSRDKHLRNLATVVLNFEVAALLPLLGAKPQTPFPYFNRDYLKPAIKEINDRTDLELTVKTRRRQRRVVEVEFTVVRRESFQMSIPFPDQPTARTKVATKDRPVAPPVDEALVERLIDQGIEPKRARKFAESLERERIEGNLDQYEARRAAGKIKESGPGWLVKALEKDFRPKTSPAEARKAAEQAAAKDREKAREAAAKQAEQDKKDFDAYRSARLDARLAEQPEGWLKEKEQAFAERVKGGDKELGALRPSFRDKGFESPIVAAMFRRELSVELLTLPEERDINEWRQQRR